MDKEAIALVVKTSKLTARVLAKAMAAALRQMEKRRRAGLTPQGRQTVKKLMNHRAATDAIPLDGDTKLFDRVARKWNVDYAFHKTGRDKYLLFFKSGQAGAVTAAFSEYTNKVLKRAKNRQPPLREQLDRAAERAERSRPHRREKDKEVTHNQR